MRERCEIKTEIDARKEACVTRIEEVDDVAREEPEEQGNQVKRRSSTTRKHDPRQPSELKKNENTK